MYEEAVAHADVPSGEVDEEPRDEDGGNFLVALHISRSQCQ